VGATGAVALGTTVVLVALPSELVVLTTTEGFAVGGDVTIGGAGAGVGENVVVAFVAMEVALVGAMVGDNVALEGVVGDAV